MTRVLMITIPIYNGHDTPETRERLAQEFPQCEFRFVQRGEETLEDMRWAEVVMGSPMRKLLAQAPGLRWLHADSAGVDRYSDPSLYASRELVLTRSADVFSIPIAEHTIAMLLSLNRLLPEFFAFQTERRWRRIEARRELYGSSVLLLGTGNLAAELVTRLRPFGCRIAGVRRNPSKPADGYDAMYGPESLHEALGGADYVISTLPDTPATRKYMGEAEFAAMKPSAMFFNLGRGVTVDTDALTRALQEGRLAGAGLDVTDPEPLNADSPLWTMSNVIITPHSSGSSESSHRRQLECFERQLVKYLKGEELDYRVDFSAGY